jgi:hypothetical protein
MESIKTALPANRVVVILLFLQGFLSQVAVSLGVFDIPEVNVAVVIVSILAQAIGGGLFLINQGKYEERQELGLAALGEYEPGLLGTEDENLGADEVPR